jgi:predicted kinase
VSDVHVQAGVLPTAFFVIGPAGSGKSTVSKLLAREFRAAYLDKDSLATGFTGLILSMTGNDPHERDNNPLYQSRILPIEYGTPLRVCGDNLGLGSSVVCDAPFGRYFSNERYLLEAQDEYRWPRARLVVVHVVADGDFVLARLRKRNEPRDAWKIRNWQQFWSTAAVTVPVVGSARTTCSWTTAANGRIYPGSTSCIPVEVPLRRRSGARSSRPDPAVGQVRSRRSRSSRAEAVATRCTVGLQRIEPQRAGWPAGCQQVVNEVTQASRRKRQACWVSRRSIVRVLSRLQLVECPPAHVIEMLGPQLGGRQCWARVECTDFNQVEGVALPVPAVTHREHVLLVPDWRADVDDLQAELFAQLTPQPVDKGFVRIDATAGARPQPLWQLRIGTEIEVHQEHALRGVDHHGPGGGSQTRNRHRCPRVYAVCRRTQDQQ